MHFRNDPLLVVPSCRHSTMRATTTTTTTTTRATTTGTASTARGRRAESWRTASTSVARESTRPRPRTRATNRDDATTTSRLRTLLARLKNRGVDADEDVRREIERAIDALADVTEDARANERSNGRWRLEYTTEKETRFLLGLQPASTRAHQTIDGDARRLRNEVIYQRGNTEIVFTVDASIETVSEKRVRFAFTSASIRFGDFVRVPIPPVGEGWFENVYVDEDIRVSRDSRGDTLVCVRDDVQRDAKE